MNRALERRIVNSGAGCALQHKLQQIRRDPAAINGGVADMERWYDKETYAWKAGCSSLPQQSELKVAVSSPTMYGKLC